MMVFKAPKTVIKMWDDAEAPCRNGKAKSVGTSHACGADRSYQRCQGRTKYDLRKQKRVCECSSEQIRPVLSIALANSAPVERSLGNRFTERIFGSVRRRYAG